MRRLFTRTPLILFVSVLAGVLTAGLGLPVVGAAGLAARAGTDTFDSLPQELSTPPLPQVSTLLAADGSVLATVFEENRRLVTLDQVPQHLRDAVLAIEDTRFYDHNGVDLRGLARAFVTNQRAGEVRQGGSTLTQQYVKNVLLSSATTEEEQQAAVEQSAARKAREARLALAVERQLSKEQILERYLNISYFGAGAYGVGSAAQRYFSKPVEELTLAESALLAGLLQSPSAYDPIRHPERARERRDVVLARMAEVGAAPQADVDAARASDLGLVPSAPGNGCTRSPWPFFCDWIVREVIPEEPALGATPEERTARLLTGGLTIRTTLQPGMQAAADEAIARADRGALAGATALVQPGHGDVFALAVSEPYGEDTAAGQTTFPLATAGPGQGSGFQAGSTFKAFGVVAALEAGIPVGQAIESPARYESEACDLPGSGYFRNYAESEAGRIDMRRATARSTNTYFIQIAEEVGANTIARTAQRLGIESLPVDEIGDRSCSIVLGSREVSVLELANAYATLAAGGVKCKPRGLLEITDSTGAPIEVSPPQCERVLDERIAATTTDLLTGVVRGGTGTQAAIGRPVAGKTGTTDNSYAAWFAGYTPQIASAVWIGNPAELSDTGLTGGSLPASIWAEQMRAAHRNQPVVPFPRPPRSASRGVVEVPDVVGLEVSEARAVMRDAGLAAEVARREVRSRVREGRVAAQSPRGGRDARSGATVELFLSAGR